MKKQEPDLFTTDSEETDTLTARRVALDMLANVLNRKQPLDVTLETDKGFLNLNPRERAFTRMMVTTTIRRLGQIDDLINRAQDRPESHKSAGVMNILRLGVVQMFFMVVPDHASVDTSVTLAEVTGHERQKGFVNAVLRKLSREGSKWAKLQDPSRLNTPEWLLRIWIADYGLRPAAEISVANLNEAPLDITLRNPHDATSLGSALGATSLSTGTLRRMMGGNVRELEGYDDGRWWIQDASAAIAAQLFDSLDGKRVVDMCAAPGGKTLQLAAMGARVIALDRSAQRLKRLEENVKRLGFQDKVSIEIADAQVWQPKGPIDYILLDAPCSATGTIRRHPDIPHLKTPHDIANLVAIQKKLLTHAAGLLPPGGVIIYCTCSLQKDEGEHQIAQFLAENPDFKRLAVTPDEIGGYAELINPEGDLRIFPTHLSSLGGMDGFFISRLQKARHF